MQSRRDVRAARRSYRRNMSTTLVFDGLSKRFGSTLAVQDLSATVRPGAITAFLGPNGAGKTTTLRMLLGLVAPTSGTAKFDGRRYDELAHPVREVGALLEATGFHPGRSALNHLRVVATAAEIPRDAPGRVLDVVGLAEAADHNVGTFSLGMRQRLGLAVALLGDPPVLILDEPVNGLDPQGVRWLRGFLKTLANEGRTVLLSSHVLPEVEQTADDVLLIAGGRLLRQTSLAELRAEHGIGTSVRSPELGRLIDVLTSVGVRCHRSAADELMVEASPDAVGRIAAENGVVLHRLVETTGELEDMFLRLTDAAGHLAYDATGATPADVADEPIKERT
jgi:ABC-2 type transport system ATP-binding protein